MRCELIVSTYNSPDALWLSLLSAALQDRVPDGIAVADDGSGDATAGVLRRFEAAFPQVPLRHVWHADEGFRKTVIVNRAIASSDADLLIFTDGDCLLSPRFVARHVSLARPDRFCCGSVIRLSAAATATVTEAHLRDGTVFDLGWLTRAGALPDLKTRLKAAPLPQMPLDLLERLSPVRTTFSGGNASAHREAILAVNGFDETMVWGGEDKEFGIRLANSGVTGRHLRYTAPMLHLDHPRGYRDDAAVKRQRKMIREARKLGRTWTENGIERASSG